MQIWEGTMDSTHSSFESRRELITFLPRHAKPSGGRPVWMAELTQTSLLEGLLKPSCLWSESGYLMWSCPKHGGTRSTRHSCRSEAAGIPSSLPFGQQEPGEHAPWSHQVCKSSYHPSNPVPRCAGWSGKGAAHQTELSSLLRLLCCFFFPV